MKGIIQNLRIKWGPISLQTRIVFLVFALNMSLVVVGGTFFTAMLQTIMADQIGKRALRVSQSVALIPQVKKQIVKGRPEGVLQRLAESIRQDTGAEFIVIGNRESIRFSHPKPDRLGKRMVGGDNGPALDRGESYVSRAVGTLGPSIRGKVPIFDAEGGVIGIVSVGYLEKDVDAIIHQQQIKVGLLIGFLTILGILGAISIANRFKRAIFGLEPEAIAHLFSERTSIIESIREGIVAIDQEARVTVVNRFAMESLDYEKEEEIVGRHISQIIPEGRLSGFLEDRKKCLDQELDVNGHTMIVNVVPMIEDESITGVVASFRRKDEIDIVARQLSQVKEYTELLRAQTHEYSNKLHTIAGLIQTEYYREALELIGRESADYQGLIEFLAKAVPHPVLAAFIIGKYNYAQELRVRLEIDPESQMIDVPSDMNHEKLVTILGNLIDNAFDEALQGARDSVVRLSMTDVGHDLVFEVEDSGDGVSEDLTEKIFDRGFTTKGESGRGQGLHLVKRALDDLRGQLTLADTTLGGALFTVFIPKNGGD